MTLFENPKYAPSETGIDNQPVNHDNLDLITKNNKKSASTKKFLSLLIDERLSYSDIEKELGYQKGSVKVKVARLKKQGFIEIKDDKPYFTDKGNKLYRGVERMITTQEKIVDIHYHRIKAKILNKGLVNKGMDFLEKVEMIIQIKQMSALTDYSTANLKNTKIYIFHRLYGTEIRATSEHILIGIPKSLSMNVDSCLKDTDDFFNKMIPKVEKFFDIKLDTHYINQFWLSSRHIEYINHKLALLHKKYNCMDIEILDNETGERLLYFDKSGGTMNAETESRNKGVEAAYALEQLDRDIVDGKTLSEAYNQNERLKLKADITFSDIKDVLVETSKQNRFITEQVALLASEIRSHTAFIQNSARIMGISLQRVNDTRAKAGQTKLDKFV